MIATNDRADNDDPHALQADALSAEIGRLANARIAAIEAESTVDARSIREQAQTKARRQQRRALDELRAARRARQNRTRAALETEARKQAAVRAQAAIEQGWPLLAAALETRWTNADSRARWIRDAVGLARAHLPAASWVIVHPAGWCDADLSVLREAVSTPESESDPTPEIGITLRVDPDCRAGLAIETDDARLDTRLGALVADRDAVEAALLAELEHDHDMSSAEGADPA
ncbi:MAG: hypothetical protein R3E48_15750 [Burkholderiaceae bacterium]